MDVHAIIVAAGAGERAGGGVPKQFRTLGNRPIYRWSVNAFLSAPQIGRVCLVLPEASLASPPADLPSDERLIVVAGGSSRTASVRAGLDALRPGEKDIVLIHDAARPGLNEDVIERLIEALEGADAAAPALPVTDALKRQEEAGLRNIPRDDLFRIQTPQAFRAELIQHALEADGSSFVDDLAAVEALGIRVATVAGSERLSKITYEEDIPRMEKLLNAPASQMRVGTGYDVHAFAPGDSIRLCGIDIPHDRRLAGHSDADVGWHALTDAVFGALALGDLGDHFPPGDPRWKDADSGVFLRHALMLAADRGWALSSCDITLICEAPKIKPHRAAMRQRTADVAGIALDLVSLKATTTEGLGFTGRREGIAAQAIAVLSRLQG